MGNKKWSDLTETQRAFVILGSAVEVMLTTVAAADLIRRPAEQMHGHKALWAMALVVQPVGPMAYLWVHRH